MQATNASTAKDSHAQSSEHASHWSLPNYAFGALLSLTIIIVTILGAFSKGSGETSYITLPASPVALGSPVMTFLAVGDWGRKGGQGQGPTAAGLATMAGSIKTTFIMSVGDNFYENGVDSVDDASFNASFLAPYSHPSLDKPWYVILGNHDYRGAYLQVGWGGDPKNRWTLPEVYYAALWDIRSSTEVAGPRSGKPWPSAAQAPPRDACLATVFIDTVPFISEYYSSKYASQVQFSANIRAANTTAQLVWLESALNNASAVCNAVMVFGHHPVYSGGSHGDEPDMIDTIKPMLDRHGVDAYVCGHDHMLNHLTDMPDGVQYVVTGAGSEVRTDSKPTRETKFLADVGGFTAHSTNGTHLIHTYIASNGTLLFQAATTLRRKA